MSATAKFSVFLVEDEAMIVMMAEDMLVELGYRVAARASNINEAMRLAKAVEFDLAILDVNIKGRSVYPVADLIKKRVCPSSSPQVMAAPGLRRHIVTARLC